MTEQTDQELHQVAQMTKEMADSQQHITDLGKERRRMWFELWNKDGVSQQRIANACGINRNVVCSEIKRFRAEAGI